MGTEFTSVFSYNEDAHSVGLEWGLSFCISIKFPSDASAPIDNTVECVGFVEFSTGRTIAANIYRCCHAKRPHHLPVAEITNRSNTFSS